MLHLKMTLFVKCCLKKSRFLIVLYYIIYILPTNSSAGEIIGIQKSSEYYVVKTFSEINKLQKICHILIIIDV